MATEKKITSRIQQKHDVAANWAKATNFIPKKGEIIIYDAEYSASGVETQAVRFKIGDGSKTVNNLPFAVIDYSSDIETLEQKVANNSTAIGALQENTVPKTRKINNKALSSDITLGAADVGVNETTFPGLKKTGTVTGVKMNGTTKTPSSGVVDLGTVLTDESKFATAAQGTKADNAMPKKGGTFDGDVTMASGHHLKTDLIKSADDTKWIAEITSNGLEVGGSGTPLRFYSSTRPVVANQNKELAYISDISTVNNGKLTIQKNGTDVATFTANQSTNSTANITVPVKVSELTNDSGYTTNKGTVTQVKINGATKSPDSAGLVDLGTGFAKTADLPIKSATLTGTTLYLTL